MCRSALIVALWLACGSPAWAQLVTSFGASAATVNHEGFSTAQALTLAPRAEWRGPGATVLFDASFAVHEVADYSIQGGPRFYAVSEPLMGPFRLGLDFGIDGTLRSDAPWTASSDAVAEMAWLGWREGFAAGFGLVTGGLQGRGPVSAGRMRMRLWKAWERVEALASIEPVWLPDTRYAEFTVRGGLVWNDFEALGGLFHRAGSGLEGGTAVQAAVRWFVTPVSALELGAGSYLEDPIQSLPAGRYAMIGVRFFDRTPRTPPLSPVGRGVYESDGAGVPLEFQLPRAETVEIAGDWNGWVPVPMEFVGDGRWRVVLTLPRGIYHFNVRLDGSRWVVPEGVTVLDDGFGGKQGVFLVM